MHNLKTQSIEFCFDERNVQMLERVKELGFRRNYYWFIYDVKADDVSIKLDKHIKKLKNKYKIKKLLIDQCHELAKRDPDMFDENGEEKGWWKSGKQRLVYCQDNKIVSVLTFQKELDNNLHLYLAYTVPELRSQGLGSKMLDWVKKYAADNGIKTITACTDTTKENKVPKMLMSNDFRYFKTGFDGIIKK